MIVRRVKGNIIKITNSEDVCEVESYSFLNMNSDEVLSLLFSSKCIVKEDDSINVFYVANDDADKTFKAIAHKHHANTVRGFIDTNVKYKANFDEVPGTSVLLRDPEKHTIRVAYRKTKRIDECNINTLLVNNTTRDMFFDCARRSKAHEETGKFVIDSRDESYSGWSQYMNDRYIEITKQGRQ